MSNTFCKNVSVKVVAAVPGSWASHASVVTAPRLLVCRPSKVPVGVAFMAVVLKDMGFVVSHLRPVHNVRWRWYWDILELGSRWHWNWLVHLVDDKGSLLVTCSLMLSTAIVLLTLIPQGLPGMIPIVASGRKCIEMCSICLTPFFGFQMSELLLVYWQVAGGYTAIHGYSIPYWKHTEYC